MLVQVQTPEVQKQIELEQLFSKNQLLPRVRAVFENSDLPFRARMEEHQIPTEFGFDLLVQMAIHCKANISTLVGLLRHHFANGQECADMLYRAAVADLVEWSSKSQMFECLHYISRDVQDELDKFQYPMPMIVEPLPLKGNKDTGYYLDHRSVILNKNHTNDDVALDHLNRMNQIKLTVNMDVVKKIANSWRNLDKLKPGETKEKFDRRKRAFEKFDKTAKDVLSLITSVSNTVYLTHAYDKRGRTYCRGYHYSYQSTPWCKAIVELADKELVE